MSQKSWLRLSFVLFSLFITTTAYCDGGNWTLSGGTSASVDMQSATTGTTTTIGVGLGIGHFLSETFEAALLSSYFRTSTSGSAATVVSEFDGVLRYKLMGATMNALYVGPELGLRTSTISSVSTSAFIMGVVVGNRIPLGGSMSYDPNVSISFSKTTSGMSSPLFHIVPFQFTLFFGS